MKLGAVAAFWLAVGSVQIFNWGHGIPKALVMLLFLLAAPFVVAAARNAPTALAPGLRRAVLIATVALLAIEIVYLGARMAHPHLIDVPVTTLAAAAAVLHGQNPYVVPLDTGPETMGFSGYKYLPVMIFAYLPLGTILGQRGVLLTNLVLFIGCLWLMKRLARSNLAPLLFLALPLVVQQIFAKGTTDLVAVTPLLAAFAVAERSEFLSGLCVGLSIAAKPVPGLLFLPCLIPPTRRRHYAAGVAAGLTPILPFLFASPTSLFANTVWFNLTRVPDATSWLENAPDMMVDGVHILLIVAIVAASAYVWQQAPPLATRCGLGAMLTIATILGGPGAHHNYQLWWLPFYAVILSLAVAGSEACQETAGRYTSAAKLGARGS